MTATDTESEWVSCPPFRGLSIVTDDSLRRAEVDEPQLLSQAVTSSSGLFST